MHLKFDINNGLKIFLSQNLFQYTDLIRTYFTTLWKRRFIIHIFSDVFGSIQADSGSSNSEVFREIVA